MKQKLSFGSKCECNCHGREGTIEYCGYLPIHIEKCPLVIDLEGKIFYALKGIIFVIS